MMTTIPVPTYIFTDDELESLRATLVDMAEDDPHYECERALACIGAIIHEERARRRPPPRAGWPVKLRLVP